MSFFHILKCMTEKTNQTIKSILYILGITIAVYLGMRFILPMVIPFLSAYAMAWILHGVVHKVRTVIHLPRGIISLAAVGVLTVLILAPLLFLAYKGICELALLLSDYENLMRRVDVLWCDCCERIEQLSGMDAVKLRDIGRSNAVRLVETARSRLVPYAMNASIVSLKYGAAVIAQLFVVLVAAVLILNDYERMMERLKECVFYKYLERIGNNMRHAGGSYIKAQLIIISMICAVCVLALFLTGNPYALVVGITIGLCDALPFIGTGLILIPWLIIELLRGQYLNAVIFGILFVVCSFIREFVEPKLVGKGIGVHPIAVLMSIYIGIYVYGAAGVILGPVSAFLILELYGIVASGRVNPKCSSEENPDKENSNPG